MPAADFIQAIRYRLVNDAGVSALVASRVYPQVLPQGASLPAITFEVAGGYAEHGSGADDMERPTLRVNVWDIDKSDGTHFGYAGIRALGDAVKSAINRLADVTIDGFAIDSTFCDLDVDDYEPDTRIHRRILEFEVNHG